MRRQALTRDLHQERLVVELPLRRSTPHFHFCPFVLHSQTQPPSSPAIAGAPAFPPRTVGCLGQTVCKDERMRAGRRGGGAAMAEVSSASTLETLEYFHDELDVHFSSLHERRQQ